GPGASKTTGRPRAISAGRSSWAAVSWLRHIYIEHARKTGHWAWCRKLARLGRSETSAQCPPLRENRKWFVIVSLSARNSDRAFTLVTRTRSSFALRREKRSTIGQVTQCEDRPAQGRRPWDSIVGAY